MNTEIDMEMREKTAEDPGFLAEAEASKEKAPPEVSQGPDYMGTGLPRSSPSAS